MADWQTIKLHKDVISEIDKFLESKYGKMMGFTSRSQFIIHSIRKQLFDV